MFKYYLYSLTSPYIADIDKWLKNDKKYKFFRILANFRSTCATGSYEPTIIIILANSERFRGITTRTNCFTFFSAHSTGAMSNCTFVQVAGNRRFVLAPPIRKESISFLKIEITCFQRTLIDLILTFQHLS